MATTPLEVTTRHRAGVTIMDLKGEINRASEDPLGAAYEEAVKNASSAILLNFDGVDYINSTGIAVIVGLLARARKDHRGVTAFELSDHYRQIFEITRLADFMNILADEESAVADVPA